MDLYIKPDFTYYDNYEYHNPRFHKFETSYDASKYICERNGISSEDECSNVYRNVRHCDGDKRKTVLGFSVIRFKNQENRVGGTK